MMIRILHVHTLNVYTGRIEDEHAYRSYSSFDARILNVYAGRIKALTYIS